MEDPNGKIGPYKLVRKIGSGTFGTVWLAEKSTPIATMQVALKLPHTKNIKHEALKREAEIWIQASGHPNVLRLIDADIYANQVVIVSEYVPDGSLSKWLEQHGGSAPSFKAASEMIDGVLAGLQHLHERHIIHRDLKPDNILLQSNAPLLSDFGLSRLIPSSSYSLTIGGTPIYMAPEAFSYKRNEQTDVWSVGIIFYQLLTGRPPYYHSDIELLREAIAQHDPPPLPLSIPANLRWVVEKSLQRDPAHRYKSAAEMRRDLQEANFKLRVASPSVATLPRAEPSVLEVAPTLIAPDISVPLIPASSAPPPKREVPQEPSPKPTVREMCRAAFWIFLGQQPSLPLKTKLINFVDQTFWESMGLACSLTVIFTLVFTFGGGKNVRDLAFAKLGMIAFYFFLEVVRGYFNVRIYLINPKKEPELLQFSEWNDDWFGLFWRARMRRWATLGLLIEILCLTGKYLWDPSLTWKE